MGEEEGEEGQQPCEKSRDVTGCSLDHPRPMRECVTTPEHATHLGCKVAETLKQIRKPGDISRIHAELLFTNKAKYATKGGVLGKMCSGSA